MKRTCRMFLRCQEGVATIIWAILVPTIAVFSGLAVDTGVWYVNERNMQNAADAAAIAAAHSINGNATQAQLTAIAQAEANRNGVGAAQGVTVSAQYPPTSGSYANDTTAVKITFSKAQNRFLSTLGLSSNPTLTVSATSRNQSTGSACMMALNTSDSNALNFNGNMNLAMGGCTLASNSTHGTSSININGNATVTAYQLYSAGDIRSNGNITKNLTAGEIEDQAPIPDPYSSYDVPAYSGCDQNNYSYNDNGDITVNPGTYCNGLGFNGNGSVTMNPGTYIIDRGDFSINGNVDVYGEGVTIILTSSTGSNHAGITFNGNGDIDLSAPTSGDHAGMLIYRDRDASSGTATFNGNASVSMTGVMYMPSQTITFNGNFSTSNATCTQIIGDKINMNGNMGLTTSCAGTGVSAIAIGAGVQLLE